jgi:hypothetical protein
MRPVFKVSKVLAAAFLIVVADGGCESDSDPVRCGEGTVLVGGACAPASPPDAGIDASSLLPTFEGIGAVAPSSAASLFVAWNDATGATPPERMRYMVFVAPAGTPIDYTQPALTTAPGTHAAYLTGLEAKPYDVAVRALDESDRSDTNVVVKSATPAGDTAPPVFGGAKSAETGGGGAVKLSWEPAQDDLTTAGAMVYLVYVADEATTEIDLSVPTLITKPGATSVEVPGLFESGALYRFVVRARDAAENVDANTTAVTARPGADTTPPRFEGCKAAFTDNAGSATVSWDAATDDVTPADRIAYDIYASTDERAFDFTKPAASATKATSVRVEGLTSNTTWRFVCRARDFSGNTDANLIQRATKTLTDTTAPTFGGLTSADVDSVARTVTFSWSPAADDKTSPGQMIYDVYEANTTKGQTFDGTPRASSAPGATQLTVGDLTPDTTLYWVVRARDQGGNHDSNTVESNGSISVSYSRQVQPLFTRNCAVSGCHVPGNPMAGLVLASGFSYDALVNVKATQTSDLRVEPTNPSGSYIYKKITQNPPPVGWQMPAPATGSVLTKDEKDLVGRWILQGAANN